MKDRLSKAFSSAQNPAWTERLSQARAVLVESVKASKPSHSLGNVDRALRKIVGIVQDTAAISRDQFSVPIVITREALEAEKAFKGYFDGDRGSMRFDVLNQDVEYMIKNPATTSIHAAEVITHTKVFGFTAVKLCELYDNPEIDERFLYFSVRLTPRKFEPPKI